MKPKFSLIEYSRLSSRQQENFNFQKVSAVLADFGYSIIRLTDDWHGADFIAQHCDGITFLKVQLKGRLYFSKKYQNKQLWMCFRYKNEIYLFPHDEALDIILRETKIGDSKSWKEKGSYSFPGLSKKMLSLMQSYVLKG